MVVVGRYHGAAVTTASSGATSRSATSRSTSSGGPSAAPSRKASAKPEQPVVPDVPGVARIIAIANQKGGVGKSTTAVSLGAALADLGYRVLVVDLDPQGNASTGMGIRHEARSVTVYDVVVAEVPVTEAIVHTPVERLHAIPSTIDLAGAEIELVSQFSREQRLKKALEAVREGVYDFIFMDCPPSLGLLTVNALTAAEELIVPIQCEYYALEGLGQLLRNVSLVQQNINPGLRLSGIVMTMYDPRTRLSEQVVAEVRNYFGDLVYGVIIPRTVRLSEAPGFGQPITVYDPKSKGAESYRELAREVAVRPPPTEPMPVYEDLPTVVVPPVENSTAVPAPPEPDPEPVERASDPEPEPTPAAVEIPPEPEPAAVEIPPEPEPAPIEMAQAEPVAEQPPIESPPPPPVAEIAEYDIWEDEDSDPPPRVRPPASPPAPGHLPERRVVVIDEHQYDSAASAPPAPPQVARPDDLPDDRGSSRDTAGIGTTLENEQGGTKRRWRLFRKGGK
jgi:chromosome partitioning protein